MPASRYSSLSPLIAFAVKVTIGTRPMRAGPEAVDQLLIKAGIPEEARRPFEQGFVEIRKKFEFE